jgi:hypothetical protein
LKRRFFSFAEDSKVKSNNQSSRMKHCKALLALPLLSCGFASAYTASRPTSLRQKIQLQQSASNDQEMPRRALLGSAFAAALLTGTKPAMAQDEIPITPFNGLIFNYRGSDYGGLDATTLNEPSVSYKEFAELLVKGEVEFVEFMAPDGDAAYVTFKGGKASAKPIRIGEGYPIEQHDGWSSPAFVIRTVKNYNVPYKFTVPGLATYKP